ncbi:hypothetical protein HPB47_018781 [Ixodes persulcatus]|uniref:Uncharacterized protein n=1 Tax=Ixodes persulcatus TaxID=34615 RepID=A0AC60QJX9_IXOPE|nr:hypothetical protein HPB47_018781 [Ixodes persulcatus]
MKRSSTSPIVCVRIILVCVEVYEGSIFYHSDDENQGALTVFLPGDSNAPKLTTFGMLREKNLKSRDQVESNYRMLEDLRHGHIGVAEACGVTVVAAGFRPKPVFGFTGVTFSAAKPTAPCAVQRSAPLATEEILALRCHGNAQCGPPRLFHVPKDVFRVVCYPYFAPDAFRTKRLCGKERATLAHILEDCECANADNSVDVLPPPMEEAKRSEDYDVQHTAIQQILAALEKQRPDGMEAEGVNPSTLKPAASGSPR